MSDTRRSRDTDTGRRLSVRRYEAPTPLVREPSNEFAKVPSPSYKATPAEGARMNATRTPQDPETGRRLTARRARAARGRLATYIHEVSDRHRTTDRRRGSGEPIEEPHGS
jgi:hypothetical protein